MSKKGVSLGIVGETPKKVTSYSIHEPPTAVPRASPSKASASPTAGDIQPGKSALLPASKYQHPNPSADVTPPKSTVPPRPPSKKDAFASPTTLETKANTARNAVRNTSSYLVDGRPKTSRGKSCPSPDEFFDYVIPSPQKDLGTSSTAVIGNNSNSLFEGVVPPSTHESSLPPYPPVGRGMPQKNSKSVQNMIVVEEGSEDSEDSDSPVNSTSRGPREQDDSGVNLYSRWESGDGDGSSEEEDDSDGSGYVSNSDDSYFGSNAGSKVSMSTQEYNRQESQLLACWLFACALKA